MAAETLSENVYGDFIISVAGVNPANHTAVASVNTAVSHSEVQVGDRVSVETPPAALEAGIVPIGCHTVVAGSFQLRTTNPTAGAIDPAAATWEFRVCRTSP
ncbi:MAG: hypothetical protein ACRD1K_01655 [Acidimicrobiales bacterium]